MSLGFFCEICEIRKIGRLNKIGFTMIGYTSEPDTGKWKTATLEKYVHGVRYVMTIDKPRGAICIVNAKNGKVMKPIPENILQDWNVEHCSVWL